MIIFILHHDGSDRLKGEFLPVWTCRCIAHTTLVFFSSCRRGSLDNLAREISRNSCKMKPSFHMHSQAHIHWCQLQLTPNHCWLFPSTGWSHNHHVLGWSRRGVCGVLRTKQEECRDFILCCVTHAKGALEKVGVLWTCLLRGTCTAFGHSRLCASICVGVLPLDLIGCHGMCVFFF